MSCLVFVNRVSGHHAGVPAARKTGDNALLRKLGKSIQAQRRDRKLTQERVAEIVGISTRTYQSVEAGGINPPTTTLVRIAKALGRRVSALLDGIE